MMVFDLDGTLTDITERWYQLHRAVAATHGIPVLERDLYISQKRSGITELAMLNTAFPDIDTVVLEAYETERVARIEEPEFLAYDRVWDGIPELLASCAARHELILVTKRRNKVASLTQLEGLGLTSYFKDILIAEGRGKQELLEEAYPSGLAGISFVTDAREDHAVAEALGMHPIIVGYGCRSSAYFARHGIPGALESVQELSDILEQI